MDMLHDGTHKLSKFASEDVISSMPDIVITNVLDRLPIQDAVKTSVLSKNWCLKWTLLTQLVFDDEFFEYLERLGKETKYNERDIIGRLLLNLKGPVTKFDLSIPMNTKVLDGEVIYHWVLFLSRRGCKDLTLLNLTMKFPSSYELPAQLFSCTGLKHLRLDSCCLRHLRSSSGLPNLISLKLFLVQFESYYWADFFTQCPLLEILEASVFEPIGERELNQIAKLVNLKILYLRSSTIISISKLSLPPKLQELTLSFYGSMFWAEAGAINAPTAFLCLEDLSLEAVDFNSDKMVSFVFKMICGSPNMQTLLIEAEYNDVPPSALSSSYFACNSMGQLQLRSVKFEGFRGSENEVYLIKSLLACSPLLKNVSIGLNSSKMVGGADGKFMFANKLLKLYRSSPIVEIDLN